MQTLKIFAGVLRALPLVGLAASLVLIGGPVSAQDDYTITPCLVPGTSLGTTCGPVPVDDLQIGYAAVVTQTISGDGSFNGDDPFTETGWFQGTSFKFNNGGVAPGVSDLGVEYGLYGIFSSAGTASLSGTLISSTFSSFTGTLYLDKNFSSYGVGFLPTDGSTPTPDGDDVSLATFTLISGSAITSLDPGAQQLGDFQTFLLFTPTADGELFFGSPSPFFVHLALDGTVNLNPSAPDPPGPVIPGIGCGGFPFNGAGCVTTVLVTGSGDAIFVPEPGTLTLLGFGLAGLGLLVLRRRRQVLAAE